MAKAATKKKAASVATSLQNALAFCAVAFKPVGPDYITHVTVQDKLLTAFDGVVAAGFPIDDELHAYPHGQRLRDALNRSGAGLSMVLAGDGSRLDVRLGQFSARVPCLAPDAGLAPVLPDPVQLQGGNELRDAFGAVAHLASNTGQTVVEASILLQNMTATATDRTTTVMQYWHGVALPKDFVLPRAFTQAVWAVESAITGIGWSDNTFTAHYANGAWLRTQLFADPWPDLSAVFGDMTMIGEKLPDGFFDACADVMPFAGKVKTLVIGETVTTADGSAVRELTGLNITPPLAVSGDALKNVAGRVDRVDWHTGERAIHFYGGNLRASIMRLAIPTETGDI